MEFEKVTKTIEVEGVKFELWLNPPRRLLRELLKSETEDIAKVYAAKLLGIEPEDIEEMPYMIARGLLGFGDRQGWVWRELEAYAEEVLKNFDGGSGSGKTE